LVIARDGLDHLARALAGGGIVQVDQRSTVDGLLEHRKLATDGRDVEAGGRRVKTGFGCAHVLRSQFVGGTHAPRGTLSASAEAANRSSRRCSRWRRMA